MLLWLLPPMLEEDDDAEEPEPDDLPLLELEPPDLLSDFGELDFDLEEPDLESEAEGELLDLELPPEDDLLLLLPLPLFDLEESDKLEEPDDSEPVELEEPMEPLPELLPSELPLIEPLPEEADGEPELLLFESDVLPDEEGLDELPDMPEDWFES